MYTHLQTTPASDCRWAVGVVTRATNRKPLTDNYLVQLTNWGYHTWEMPPIEQAVICSHPWTTLISVYLAPWKVYPAITKFLQVS